MASKRRPRAPRIKMIVTDEMIQDAIPRDSGHCVFAEAVKAAFPNASKVAVDLQTIRFTDPGKMLRYTYLTPRPVQLALVNFDQGHLPIPFNIELRNGQVTAAGRTRAAIAKPVSPKAAEAARRSAEKARAHRKELGKATLVVRNEGSVPDIVGGKPPPVAPGRRRAFGIRALER